MQITIHRGSCEIGGSCVELKHGQSRIVLDLGMPLVDPDGSRFSMGCYADHDGPQLVEKGVLPDIPGLYSWDPSLPRPDGLLLSHAHMDHYGFSSYLHQEIHCYMGRATARLLELNTLFTPFQGSGGTTVNFENARPFSCGAFRITPYLLDHSAFDAYAFLVESPDKSILYSGDFREHGRKPHALERMLRDLSGKNLDAILLEGTMFGRSGEKIITEQDIETELVALLRARPCLTQVCVSGQNIDRLVTLYRAALRCHRILVVDVYTASILRALNAFAAIPHPSPEYTALKVFFPFNLTRRLIKSGHGELVYAFRDYKITREEIVEQQNRIIMTVRPSLQFDLKRMPFDPGANFIYSMWRGYREEGEMKALIDYANEQQMVMRDLHSSGHAGVDTLKKVVNTLTPGAVIPIHTFHPEMYGSLGVKVRAPKDKQAMEL